MSNKKLLFFLFLFLQILFSQSQTLQENAENYNEGMTRQFEESTAAILQNCEIGRDYSLDLAMPSLLVGFAMILITIIGYYAGVFFQSQEIIRFSKEEFYQSFQSIILAFLIITAVFGVNSGVVILKGFVGYDADLLLDQSIAFSRDVARDISQNLSVMVFINGVLTFFASSSISFGSFQGSFSFSPGLALKPLTDVVTLAIQFLSVALAEWFFHIFSLCFIKRWAISVFLPLAMILRAIPYTRDGGSGLMALVLCLYIIYPITFIGMQETYNALTGDSNFVQLSVDFIDEFTGTSTLIAFALAFVSGGVFVPLMVFGAIETLWFFINEAIFVFFIMSLMLPFFSILITLTATREISKNIFNADINLSSIIMVI